MQAGLLSFANGSVSSLYGCIGYAVQDMVVSRFPKDYLKSITMSSELATRNYRRLFGANTNNEIAKKVKPWMVIQPIYNDQDRSEPLQGIPLTTNFDNLQYGTDHRYLFEVIRDVENGYSLKFRMNRDRIEYDVSLVVSTLHQQLDIYKVLKNQLVWDRPFANTLALEAVIPKSLIAQMGKLSHMDIEEHEEFIPTLLHHLNRCSGYPITYKLRNASATDEWFMYYTHNVIMTYSDLNIESGTRKGMSEDRFPITFRVTAEFNLPGVYFLDGIKEIVEAVDLTLKTKEYNSDNDAYIPIFTLDNLYNKFPPEMDGLQLYGTSLFKVDDRSAKDSKLPLKEDRVNLKCILDEDHIKVLRAHRSWSMNPTTLLKIIVLKNREELKYETDYSVDWDSLDLIVKNPDSQSTYRIAMYFNFNTVNEILSNTTYLNVQDTSILRENKFPEQGLEDGSFMAINGTPNNQAIQLDGEMNPSEKRSDPDFDPSLILEKDRIIMHTNDEYDMVLNSMEPEIPGKDQSDKIVVHGSNPQLAFDPQMDQGIPIEKTHFHLEAPTGPIHFQDGLPIEQIPPADLHNKFISDEETLAQVKAQLEEENNKKKSDKPTFPKKKYHLSVE